LCIGKGSNSQPSVERQTAEPAGPSKSAPLTYEFSEKSIANDLSGTFLRQTEDKSCTASLEFMSRPCPEQLIELGQSPLAVVNSNNGLQRVITWPHHVWQDYWEPSPTIGLVLCSPASELHYFGQILCCNLLICDPIDNPIRHVTVAQVRTSALYNALLKYLTAEYLNKTIISEEAQSVLNIARIDTIVHLESIVSQKSNSAAKESLLALIMFGLAASWDGSNNTGVYYYRHAASMYSQISTRMSLKDRRFYEEALTYWWSGLTFVTDATVDRLSDPPKTPFDRGTAVGSRAKVPPVNPHPLTGVSSESCELMGKVGRLIYRQRNLALEQAFFSIAAIRGQKQMLQESQQLEEELWTLQIPMVEDVCTTYDANTPAVHMCNASEVSRLCSLLLLYRCFPDLLKDRLAQGGVQEPTAMERYMSASALHALHILERNGATSRTRSVEQILLVIIAGELRLPNQLCSPSFPFVRHDASLLPESSTIMSTSALGDISLLSALDCNALQSTLFDPRMCETMVDDGVDVETQNIVAARAIVSTRMSAVRHILPYKSVEQAEGLIWNVWSKSDNGEQSFWMDDMIRNNQRFVMV
jgi:hypothetical protein